ncbi:MAG: hypothetical protein ABI234_01865 [Ktedonobacteraceae bacterium]
MPRIDEAAYRQFKATPTEWELRELYTPTLDERLLAQQHTTGKSALVAFLVAAPLAAGVQARQSERVDDRLVSRSSHSLSSHRSTTSTHGLVCVSP